jgi:hypothetical protein
VGIETRNGLTAAGPNRAEEEEKEHFMDLGFDAEGDDPTGADEEWRYFKKQTKFADNKKNPKKVEQPKEKRKEGQKDFDLDVVRNDESAMIGDAIIAQTTYDQDNPNIEVHSTFVDKDEFMLLMKQYANKREFEIFVVHSDRNRYRAKCADLECDWKIYVKKLLGCPTFKVV